MPACRRSRRGGEINVRRRSAHEENHSQFVVVAGLQTTMSLGIRHDSRLYPERGSDRLRVFATVLVVSMVFRHGHTLVCYDHRGEFSRADIPMPTVPEAILWYLVCYLDTRLGNLAHPELHPLYVSQVARDGSRQPCRLTKRYTEPGHRAPAGIAPFRGPGHRALKFSFRNHTSPARPSRCRRRVRAAASGSRGAAPRSAVRVPQGRA